jgi:hypothetical protein
MPLHASSSLTTDDIIIIINHRLDSLWKSLKAHHKGFPKEEIGSVQWIQISRRFVGRINLTEWRSLYEMRIGKTKM